MEITTKFETYIIVDDEEIKAEITAVGDLVEDGNSCEFGFTSSPVIDNVFVTAVYDIENDREIGFSTLPKTQRKNLLALAQDELDEREKHETYDDDDEF
jgi:hypothetical protein